MKLKKLVLQGYKTFASKTEFVFEGGITAVVGPNGSGKSNVADAIRWCLGEQSYSTLRGKRTTDMIFSGSQSRARAGLAQATLTLDNESGWLPIDYTEVEICRRAYRSGENEYLLNGQKVRLKDISELLAGAGLSEQTYTIIGQGLIDRALSLKADERRALFEEAAGISHYKSRRATTLRKLQDTQRNLQRVHDILGELKPRMNSLKRQADRAENYHLVQIDLKEMLRTWYGFQWEEAKTVLRAKREEAAEAEKIWSKERGEMQREQEAMDTAKESLHEAETAIQEIDGRREEVREVLERVRREVAILTERRASLEGQLAETKEDVPLLEEQLKTAQSELDIALAGLKEVQTEWDSQRGTLQTFEKSFKGQQEQINTARKRVNTFEREEREIGNLLAQREGQLGQLEERLADVQKQSAGAGSGDGDNELVTLAKDGQKFLGVASSAKSKVDELAESRRKIRETEQGLEKQIKTKRRELEDARKKLNRANREIASLQAKVEMLDRMRQKEASFGAEIEVVGRLSKFLTIPADISLPIELALQSRLSAVVVPDEINLWRIVSSRELDKSLDVVVQGESSTLDRPSLPDGALGWADELVTASSGKKELIAQMLGRILLTTTGKQAYAAARGLPVGFTVVSKDGLIAHATGQSSGVVELPRLDVRNSAVARENEFREAQIAFDTQQDAFGDLDNLVADLQKELRNLNNELETEQKERRRLGNLVQEAEQRVNRAQRDLDRVNQQKTFIERQNSGRQQEMTTLSQRIEKTQADIAGAREKVVIVESSLHKSREALAALPVGEAEQQRDQLNQQVQTSRSIMDGRRAIVDSRRATLVQFETQLERLKNRRREWSMALLKMEIPAASKDLEKLEAEMKELNEKRVPHRELRKVEMQKIRELEGKLSMLRKAVQTIETRYTNTKIALTTSETRVENLKERISNDIGIVQLAYEGEKEGEAQVSIIPLPIDDLVEQLPTVDELPEGLNESIQKLRGQMSRMGAINPDAPTEYKSVAERHGFLEEQILDLNQTEEQLRKVIDELDELTSKKFAETVTKVNVEFGQMFTRLFGGGSAELNLTDPDDLTITGVEIVAQLPGRRPQGLALLSGGERSLTAASLIFSLLKVSPTPFCVMDEVDAALDEANVNRFRDALSELSEDTQFVVITHNRGTVQAASTIYGITMGSDSTSQVISVKPEEYVHQDRLIA
ncbi:MAG: chromosome segregation protein [Cellvibrionaceae bacterium]|jgi:chromosome segregation protein